MDLPSDEIKQCYNSVTCCASSSKGMPIAIPKVLTSPCQKNEYVFNLARYNELSHNSHEVL